jgi:hypothetical protein
MCSCWMLNLLVHHVTRRLIMLKSTNKCTELYTSLRLEYSILLRIIILNTNERKCQSIATIMINFIWLHVSTRNESSSGHLNLMLWPNSDYKWNVSSLCHLIRLYSRMGSHRELTFHLQSLFGQRNKFKLSEDDLLRVETCSHMKFIIIYI